MVYYLLLFILPFVSCCQIIAQKQYTMKSKSPNVLLFSAGTALIALLFFIITSGFELSFDARLLPYSLIFAVGYAAAWIGTVFAVRYGSMALTSLITSFSLLFPTAYGILQGETPRPTLIVGVVLLLAAIVLVNLRFSRNDRFSMKWFLCVMLSFVGNGSCSVIQNMQKRTLGDAYSHEFMIIALAAAFLLLILSACLTSRNIISDLRACLPCSTLNGVSNAMVHFLLLILIGNIPNIVLYPTSSALGMVITFLLSFIVYKERFTKPQYAGYALGVLSIILLNL